jgi:hypothetical protein
MINEHELSYMKMLTLLACEATTVLALTATQSLAQSVYEPYTFSTLAGGGGYSNETAGNVARFFGPTSVAVDSAGNLYVADGFNQVIRKVTPAGAVTTLAGQAGIYGITDGTGSDAQFNFFNGAAAGVDSAGNVYVADTSNHTIRKVTPGGLVTTIAGLAGVTGSANGNGNAARFSYPFGVTADSAGNVYVADSGNGTIRKLTPLGTNWAVTTLAGQPGSYGSTDGTGGVARFNFPVGVTVDSAGVLYVVDPDNQNIRKITPVGTTCVVTTLAGDASIKDAFGNPLGGYADGTNRTARFKRPFGVAVDSVGNLYVADEGNSVVRKLTLEGTNWVVTTIAGVALLPGSTDGIGSAARFDFPFSVAVDASANVYVADTTSDAIRKLTLVGTNWVVTTAAGRGGNYGSAEGVGSSARFAGPSGLAVDSAGNTYVADQLNHAIRKVTANGLVTTVAGSPGYAGSADGTNTDARFNYPAGITVDSAGNLYVADSSFNLIRKVTPVGTNWVVTTLAGPAGTQDQDESQGSVNGVGTVARFVVPLGVAVDSLGNVYVADTINCQIRKVTPGGAVSTVAGSAGTFGSADGIGAGAQFHCPSGVAVDGAMNVYVADTWNHTIRKVTRNRVVTTLAGFASSPGNTDGIAPAARFYFPSGVAVDSATNVYVADTFNNTIRKLTPVGTNWVVTTLGGMSGIWGSADGRGSAARFSNPTGVAVDSSGNIYVADHYLNTIRKGYAPPTIRSPGFNAGQFGFNIIGPPGQLVVEASPDLVSWLPISTNTFTGTLNFSDPQGAGSAHRFYRAQVR